jgi:hypothetical protein
MPAKRFDCRDFTTCNTTKKNSVLHQESHSDELPAGVHNRRQFVLKEVLAVVTGSLIDFCRPVSGTVKVAQNY